MIKAKQKQLKGPKVRYPYDVGFEIARFAAKAIHVFRHSKRHSYPGDITDEQWEKELEEMEWALREVADSFPHDPYNMAWDAYWKTKDNKPDPTEYAEQVEEYSKTIQKGLQLFAHRLCDLWD